MNPTNSYKHLKDQSNLESLLVLDDKGFTIYNSQGQKQQPNTHNYFQLYQLSKFFYPEDAVCNAVVGIQTNDFITMIKADQSSGQQKIIVIKQKISQSNLHA